MIVRIFKKGIPNNSGYHRKISLILLATKILAYIKLLHLTAVC